MRHLSIKSFCIFAALASLTGCLKKNSMNVDPDQGYSLVLFAATGDNQATTASHYQRYYSDLGVVKVGDSKTFNINVSYSGSEVAPQDITVNLALDTAALSAYNSQDGTSYVVPPVSAYQFPSSVVIKKGTHLTQALATITISSAYDFSQSYALPIKIASTNYGVISTNLGNTIYSFGVRNKYDGHYSMKGYTLRAGDATRTGNFVNPKGLDLITVGANAVAFGDLQVWADLSGVGIGNPAINVNPDNSVTMGGVPTNNPNYTSRYDPNSRTFYISFTWGAGPSSRLATDTLVYLQAR